MAIDQAKFFRRDFRCSYILAKDLDIFDFFLAYSFFICEIATFELSTAVTLNFF